jgi:hypothetical protein
MTRKMWWLLVLGLAIVLGLFLATRALAQEKPAEPTLTKEEALQLENYELRDQTIQTQLAMLQQAAQQLQRDGQKNALDSEAFIQSLEKSHPGWLRNRQTKKWERAPQAPAPAKK